MSFIKSKLKSTREAIGKKDYANARDSALQILEFEPENYNATVFLALALVELGETDNSEQAYRRAIDSNPEQVLAWQGISKLYERAHKWEKCADALQRLLRIYSKSNDAVKCAETLQKLVDLRREQGSRAEVAEALSLFLPDSSIFTTISTLPPPDPSNPTSTTTFVTQTAIYDSLPILEEIIHLVEKEEEETVRKEVDKRRMRLGASGPELLKKEVGREVWGASKLPDLYNEVLRHPNTSDDLRRATDAKLLRHKQRYLHALPTSGEFALIKEQVANELDDLVNGAVILRIPDELAWMIFIDGKDCDEIPAYGFDYLRQFIELFPTLSLTSLLRGYFMYMNIPISDEQEEKDEINDTETSDGDPLDLILDAFASLSNSIIAHRIVAEVYFHEVDYQNVIKVAEVGLELLRRAEMDNDRSLTQVRRAFKTVLGTSLVHLFPPKHHPRALRLIDEVLEQQPTNIRCLMGRAYILQAAQKWTEAGQIFAKVCKLIDGDLDDGIRAKEEHAWSVSRAHDVENGVLELHGVLDVLNDLEDRDLDKARCLWRIGKCYWDMGDDKRNEAYKHFILSLKRHSTYAPAFTSLGIYYSEFTSPPDPIRASKCFQKAFELDAREVDAARRLAEGFAEESEWDLVEVVARRTIDGEGGLDAGLGGGSVASGRYLPTNAWAWKAVGVVELMRRNYAPAIEAFQIALRADTNDQLSWLRLGEAYSKAGRHVAALKALGRARELRPDDWMCSYFIGEVERQIGQFQDAINSFQLILTHRPSEIGVLMSLGQTHLDLGRAEQAQGFSVRAESSFVACVQVGLQVIKTTPGFRGAAWKTVADAIFFLSTRTSFVDKEAVGSILSEVISLLPSESSERLLGILSLPMVQPSSSDIKALDVAVVAYDYRVSLGSVESSAIGSAWFDLGIVLHSWAKSIPSGEHQERAYKKAITCITEALRSDPGNDTYWNALGNANFAVQPKIAQHAYIKALEVDNKNVTTWTNLGLLYLHHDDLELANEAFYRAQIQDPDHTVAWIGQALVATANGHDIDAQALFEHAISLSVNVPDGDLEFAFRTFSRLRSAGHDRASSFDILFPVFFVLDRYCKRRPDDSSALHLFGLVCERIGHTELGVELIGRAISILETAYEESEDPIVERQFTIANSNLARLRLCLHDYEGALESFESALGLLSQDDVGDTSSLLRTQAQFGSGLAHFKLGNLEAALSLLEEALISAGDNALVKGHVVVLLAQTLWAMGTEEFQESAKTQLLECIATDPENLTAINALAGMGILTEDDNLVDAALSEVLALPLEHRHKLDPQRDVNYLLTQHHLGQENEAKALSVAQSAVFAEPSQPEIRNELASLMLQQSQFGSALAVLAGSSHVEDNLDVAHATLSLHAIAEMHIAKDDSGTKSALRHAQKSIMLAPSNLQAWLTLAYVRTLS